MRGSKPRALNLLATPPLPRPWDLAIYGTPNEGKSVTDKPEILRIENIDTDCLHCLIALRSCRKRLKLASPISAKPWAA